MKSRRPIKLNRAVAVLLLCLLLLSNAGVAAFAADVFSSALVNGILPETPDEISAFEEFVFNNDKPGGWLQSGEVELPDDPESPAEEPSVNDEEPESDTESLTDNFPMIMQEEIEPVTDMLQAFSAESSGSEMYYTPVTLPFSETAALTDEDGLSLRDRYGKGYSFYAEAGWQVTVTMTSGDVDAYLYLLDDNENELAHDDDGAGGSNSKIVYILEYTGVYYVQATQYYQETGVFEISIEIIEPVEPIKIEYTPVTLPFSETASLSEENGLSLKNTYGKGYNFYGEAGMCVIITLVSDDFDAYLYLLDDSGNVLAYDDDGGGGRNSKISYTLQYTGVYYIQATQFSAKAGDFEISINTSQPDDFFEIAYKHISLPFSETSELTDEDGLSLFDTYGKGYSFYGEAGEWVIITLSSDDFDTILFLLRDNYHELASNYNYAGKGNSVIACNLPYTGVYYVQAAQYSNANGNYKFSMKTIDSIDPMGINYTHVTLPYTETASLSNEDGQSLGGTFGKGYSFHGEPGQRIVIEMISDDFDAYLYLLADNMVILAEDDDGAGGSNSKIVYTLPVTGTYHIQATQFSDTTGYYEISIKTIESVEITYSPVTISFYESSSLSEEDGQSEANAYGKGYSFYGEAGQSITAAMTSNHFTSALFLLDDDNNIVAINYSSYAYGYARIVYTLPYTGLYYIQATQTSVRAGYYEISITTTQPINYRTVTLPFSETATLSEGDALSLRGTYGKGYSFFGEAGQQITISMISDDFNSFLYLLMDSNNQIANNGAASYNARIVSTLPYTGIYYIQATLNTPGAGNYSITITSDREEWDELPIVLGYVGAENSNGFYYFTGVNLPLLPLGADDEAMAAVIRNLPDTIQAILADSPELLTLEITWDEHSGINVNEPGLYLVRGSVSTGDPPVCRFSSGPSAYLIYHLIAVWEDGSDPFNIYRLRGFYRNDGVYADDELSALLGVGEDASLLEQLDYWLSVFAGNALVNSKAYFLVDWDVPPDLHSASLGVYEITGSLNLPEFFVIEDGLTPKATIFVMERDFISLVGPTSYDRMGNPVFTWLWEIPDLAQAEFYYAYNDGDWEKQEFIIDEDMQPALAFIDDFGFFSSTELHLSAYYMDPGNHYFQFGYEGRYSNVLQVTVTPRAQGWGYDIEFHFGGDRDGTGQGAQSDTLPPVDPLPVDPPESPPGDDDDDNDNSRLPDTGDGDSNGSNPSGNPSTGDNTYPQDNNRNTNDNTTPIVSGDNLFNGSNEGKQDETGNEDITNINGHEQPEYVKSVEIDYIPADEKSSQTIIENTTNTMANQPSVQQITLDADELDNLRTTQPIEMTFIENNIKLVIPTYLLDGLELGEGEVFAVELEMEGNTFSVRLFAGEREIRGFSGETFLVYILYDTEVPLSALYCEDEQGNRYYMIGSGGDKVIFRLATTGKYTIHEEPETDTPLVIEGKEIPEAFSILNRNEAESVNNSAMPWGMIGIIGGVVLVPTTTLGIRRAKLRKKHE